MSLRLEHVALSVSDLDRSLAFYQQMLGFELALMIEPRQDELLGKVTGMPKAQARIAHLKLGDQMLELFEYAEPRGEVDRRKQAGLGFIHIGFKTNDAKADYERLRSRGVRFISPPVEFRPGVWVVYFCGPDGEICELRQT